MNTAYEYADRIATNAPLAVSATKQSANETRHSERIFATEDASLS